MRYKNYQTITTILLLTFLISKSALLYAYKLNISKYSLAKKLGWVEQQNPYNICGGYYKEFPIDYIPNPYAASQANNYNISADQTILPLKKGTLVFKKNVVVTQPNRQLTSNMAYAYRDKKTGKIAKIEAVGNVHVREPGKLLLARKATYIVKTKAIELNDVYYRLVRDATSIVTVKNPQTGRIEKHVYQLSAHGSAQRVNRVKPYLTILKSASYTTCQPNCNTWQVKGSTVKFNTQSGRGQAWNARLYLHSIPVFYTPFFTFPINNKRHTGFLSPSYGHSERGGYKLTTPFYWNIAPNYDATITPNFIQKRGVFLQGLFRYLTPHNSGNIHVGFIPSDREFKRFQKRAFIDWASAPTSQLNKLKKANDNRKSFTLEDTTTFNQHWSGDIKYNYVSDDYFIHDLSDNLIDSSENQLLRQARLYYLSNVWSFFGNLQAYQTLHRVDQTNISNQYTRLPQLQLIANFPNHPLGLYFGFNSEYTRFTFHRNPYTDTEHVIGMSSRSSLRPYISLPFNWPFAYVVPRAQLQMTQYDIQNPHYNFPYHPHVAIPIIDVNAGLYFDRNATLFHHNYQQTLEPVVYYLYAPYRKQNEIPYFDTDTQTFNYDFMFLDNRFTGIDRIGDANQITLGITTRFIDCDSGDEKASASIGRIYYFSDRKVQLPYNPTYTINQTDRRPNSSIASSATYHFNPIWSATGGLTWNPVLNMFDIRTLGVQYRPDTKHILNFDYTYQRQGDTLFYAPANSSQNDLKQTNISGYWQINKHWSIMGRWNYNWSHKHDQAFLYGIGYDSCCWAVRFAWARTFVSLDPNMHKEFDHTLYLELALKGLGTIASKDPSSTLTSSIAGYTDVFGQENQL
jgi:LPS-assembly protein